MADATIIGRLTRIWRDVLGVDMVEPDDNFYDLGGDSILGIQVVARAAGVGIRITPTQMIAHQTVAELADAAAVAGTPGRAADRTGSAPVTPIQLDLLRRQRIPAAYANQAALWRCDGVEPDLARAALQCMVDWHDAFRLRFTADGDGWSQAVVPRGEALFDAVDLTALDAAAQDAELLARSTVAQQSIDRDAGTLLSAVLFDLGPRGRRLLVVAHHLAVDGVSWRMLRDDLEAAYLHLRAARTPLAAGSGASPVTWARRLTDHASSSACRAELPLWVERLAAAGVERPEAFAEPVLAGRSARHEFSVDPMTTEALTRRLPRAIGVRPEAAVLTALGRAVREVLGVENCLVDVEGHGRENLFPDLDVSQTVGWFTQIHPVVAHTRRDLVTAGRLIQRAADTLPHNGIRHCLLRDDPALSGVRPVILVNYLGGGDGAARSLFRPADEVVAPDNGPDLPRTHGLELDAAVRGGRLDVHITHPADDRRSALVAELAEVFRAALAELVEEAA